MSWKDSLPASAKAYIGERQLDEVECIISDFPGVARGKAVPASKFAKQEHFYLPNSIFLQTLTGEWAEAAGEEGWVEPDMTLRPDLDTATAAPWATDATLQVIHDAKDQQGNLVPYSPRNVLRRVIERYDALGLKPIIAPELEFFLVQKNTDPDFPLQPPAGRNGRPETARQSYSIDAVNEFDPILDLMYDYCEAMELDVDTLIHESGAAQLEINFIHADPLSRADQVFLFKRTVRAVAKQHGVYATFMANPMAGQPGSAMHIHQSVVDAETGRNLFSNANGKDSALFRSYIAGLVKFMPQISPLWAPNVNSFRRMRPDSAAPIIVQWGEDNRSCGFRVPISDKANRRVENRLPGADSNPYLAMAASLVCGYIGMVERMVPAKAITGSAYNRARTLPRTLEAALDRFSACKPVRNLLGEEFFDIFYAVKDYELFNYQSVVSSWEREHLLLRV